MIRLNADALKELLNEIESARANLQYDVINEYESSILRMTRLEDKIREILGMPKAEHPCYHVCPGHADLAHPGRKCDTR